MDVDWSDMDAVRCVVCGRIVFEIVSCTALCPIVLLMYL